MHSYAEYCMVLHFRFKHTVGTTCMLQQLSEYLRGEGGAGFCMVKEGSSCEENGIDWVSGTGWSSPSGTAALVPNLYRYPGHCYV